MDIHCYFRAPKGLAKSTAIVSNHACFHSVNICFNLHNIVLHWYCYKRHIVRLWNNHSESNDSYAGICALMSELQSFKDVNIVLTNICFCILWKHVWAEVYKVVSGIFTGILKKFSFKCYYSIPSLILCCLINYI